MGTFSTLLRDESLLTALMLPTNWLKVLTNNRTEDRNPLKKVHPNVAQFVRGRNQMLR